MSNEPYETNHLSHGVAWHTTADGMNAHVTVGGKRVKSFRNNESAWMNAQRHAYDLSVKADSANNTGHFQGL
jgi:hypothetical protein